MFFIILITVIYLWILYYFSKQTRSAIKKTKERNSNFLEECVISRGIFSTKAFNYFGTTLTISLVFLSIIYLYSLMGTDNVSSIFGIEQSLCTAIYFIVWFGFLFTATVSIFYTWINAGVSGQFLIITKEGVIGTSCVMKGLKIQYIDFQIEASDITDIILQNGEKVLGINISSFNIITNANKYEYILLTDGYDIKRIIEENKC